MGRTATLTSKCCILYMYSTNIGTEYFKHALYSPFFFSSKFSLFHNANLFGSVLFTFYIQGVLKLKKKSGAKGLKIHSVSAVNKFHLGCKNQSVNNVSGNSLCLFCKIHTIHINELYGRKVEFLNVKPGGTYSNH